MIVDVPNDPRARALGAFLMRTGGAALADVAAVMALPLPDARKAVIVGAVESGARPVDAARLAGVSRAYAAQIARAAGWTHAQRRAARRERVAWLAASGVGTDEIARRLGVPRRTVQRDVLGR
jgi:ActR/RegA family two-component response regulator